jgi:hypothetical protein
MNARHVSAELTRLILGIDRYYRQGRTGSDDQLDREGLVPVHWSPLEPATVTDWDDARRQLLACTAEASTIADPWARNWLTEQSLAALTLVRWLAGEPLDYEQVVAGALRIDPRPPSPARVRACRAARDRALEAAGYSDYAGFLAATRVAPDALEPFLLEMIAEAEQLTRERLPGLVLPERRIGVKVVTDVAFTAYCDYPGAQMWISTDVHHTRAGLKHLVAHEAYPGHYAHIGHREAGVQRGAILDDAALVVTNTASSVLFEGIAERGLDLLNWRSEPEDQVAWLHNRLQWLGSIEAAHALNTGRRSEDEVRSFLRETCDGDEAWIDAKIRFVTHPLRAPFVYAYWWGGTIVGEWLERVPVTRLDEAIAFLYDRMHSPTTLAAHWRLEAW